MSSSFKEIYEFGEAWKASENSRITPVGNYLFTANVVYESARSGIEMQACTVQIYRNGIEDGKIEIYPLGRLQNETHHLGFSEAWQEYRFDRKSAALVISGKSGKMASTRSD